MNGYNQVSSFKLITNLFLSGERNEAFLGLFVALLEEQRRRMRVNLIPWSPMICLCCIEILFIFMLMQGMSTVASLGIGVALLLLLLDLKEGPDLAGGIPQLF